MEEEIEDIVGEVVYTDSQKTLGMNSCDYAESSSDKNYSSGRETYVLDIDESSDSEQFRERIRQEEEKELEEAKYDLPLVKSNGSNGSNRSIGAKSNAALNRTTSIQTRSVETFTQTSKTIIELAKTECPNETQTLETQTSFVCITERTVQYTSVQYSDNGMKCVKDAKTSDTVENTDDSDNQNGQLSLCLDHSLEDYSSKCPESKCSDGSKTAFESSDSSSNEEIIRIIHGESQERIKDAATDTKPNVSAYLSPKSSDSDFDEDSLVEYSYNPKHNSLNNSTASSSSCLSEVSKSVDKDVQELYNKLSESMDLLPSDRSGDVDKKKFGTLTPLSEESLTKKTSTVDITPSVEALTKEVDKDVLFMNDSGIKVKIFPEEKRSIEPFKLPPIQRNLSCPNSPHLSMLFTSNSHPQPLCKAETLPCLFEGDVNINRWANQEMASGESVRITGKNSDPSGDKKPIEMIQLPPIHAETNKQTRTRRPYSQKSSGEAKTEGTLTDATPISIQAKIKELKMSDRVWRKPRHNSLSRNSVHSRSLSPGSTAGSERLETVERGCDALCLDLLKRLRASSWFDIAETLDDIPNALRKFWGVISEPRIADFIRQISLHVESPRTQVAKTACATLACLLKNTNYTKKPDFYEAVTLLLVKTGSFSRPVRRAANVALDEVVCSVDLNHAVTALCVHGVEHKSPLVRSAAARLLVVCAALGGGGRDILRARPSTAATARRQTLRSLAVLLDDKSNDARHYAERLYTMLRPLSNFEAYFLTDVSVDVASRLMKKYDRLLLGEGEAKDAR